MAGGGNKGKMHQRTIDKINFAIRLFVGAPHLSANEIAHMIGVSPTRLNMMQKLPLWQQLHTQYVTGILTKLDVKTEANYDLTRKQLDFAVPLAMQTLVQQALAAKDERVRNKACNDLLDRDGTFAKVSRSTIKIEEPKVSDKDTTEANELIAALKEAKKDIVN